MILSMQFTYPTRELCARDNECDLIQAARGGDLDAFNAIALKYQDLLFRVAYRIFGDEAPAQDAVQEGLISAFRHMDSFRDGSLKGWLIRIVVNKAGDQLRSARCRRAISLDAPIYNDGEDGEDHYFEVADAGVSVEDRVETYQLDEAIQACLNALPLRFRTVIILADVEEMDYEDIAKILSIPIGTVKSRLARARLKLRGLLLRQENWLREKYS